MITKQARRVNITGVVQGVGFRPFVYQLARKNNLTGWVRNTSGSVLIVVEGEEGCLQRFLGELKKGPPLSHIETIAISEELPQNYQNFDIQESLVKENEYQLISPDLATCPECQREIFNSSDRRHGYPFTNCTNCGPRFTIIQDIPYDRPLTTMRIFKMCSNCQKEYKSPLDRRFHAQPNACPVCGPELELTDAKGQIMGTCDPIGDAAKLLREGYILAIKGLGGFLLACDATRNDTILRLRERKRRPAKPLAVMIRDLKEIERYCHLTIREAEILGSPAAPIVLLKNKVSSDISDKVAPGLAYLGVMLPYTPLHHLLMREAGIPLVMTSGNLSEEPIAAENAEALKRLAGIADYFLLHNREIYSQYDDSVTLVERNHLQIVRRARGYAPFPIKLSFKMKPILACGAELKNTFCLTRDNYAFVSQHIGDMENAETLDHFEVTEILYEKLFRIQPEIIACDLHPDYLPSQWASNEAKNRHISLVPVQHHHAHIVSCMTENSVTEPVIGVALDGSGYGTDGRIWGGEFLLADNHSFQRKAHLEYLPLPGGTLAIKKPYRTAIGYLYYLLGENSLKSDLPCLKEIDQLEVDLIKKQIEGNFNTPLTSSCGRLFDAVSAILGIRQQNEYEGQAAIELEMSAGEDKNDPGYPFKVDIQEGVRIIRVKDLLTAIIRDINLSEPVPVISSRFHKTISEIISQVCLGLSCETGIQQVALSGGVFQNRKLLNTVMDSLQAKGLTPLLHSLVPCNDGGISLGQAVIANFTKTGSAPCV